MDRKLLRKYLVGDCTWRRLLRSLLLLYACLMVFACSMADRMMFPAPESSYRDDAEILKITLEDGSRISALHLPRADAPFTVLYSHGNAEDLGLIRGRLEHYRRQGFSVLSYDYPGYGTSEGRPGTRSALRAAEAVLQHLITEIGVPPGRILIHGRSIGGGPSVHLAHRQRVAGLIAESTFVSAFRVMTRFPILPFDRLRNLALIDQVDCPVLVIHGRHDEIIPIWHGEALFDKARPPKQSCWLEASSHNFIDAADADPYWQAIRQFARSLESP